MKKICHRAPPYLASTYVANMCQDEEILSRFGKLISETNTCSNYTVFPSRRWRCSLFVGDEKNRDNKNSQIRENKTNCSHRVEIFDVESKWKKSNDNEHRVSLTMLLRNIENISQSFIQQPIVVTG